MPRPSITTYANIRSLSLFGSCLLHWEYIDHISQHFPALTSLRFSLSSGAISSITAKGTQNSSTFISASSDLQRSLIIPKLPNLIAFNSTTITPSERRDAELFYINHVKSRLSEHPDERESWGRYVELCKVYGRDETSTEKKPEAGLKRKMISKCISVSSRDSLNTSTLLALRVYKHPTDPSPGTLALLPSSSIKLLLHRVSRLVGATSTASPRLWTVIDKGGELEKVIDISRKREGNDWTVGWWFEDGDCVLVDEDES